jgi:hypothetical protein
MSPYRTLPAYRPGRFGYRRASLAVTSQPTPKLLAAAADEPVTQTRQLPKAQPDQRQQAA